VLLHKDDVKSSMGWIGLIFLSPFIGTILYIFFGVNRVKRKGVRLKKKYNTQIKQSYQMIKNLPKNYNQFVNFGYNIYQKKFVSENSVTPLQNGVETYPEMISEIQNAKKEILISSYIFNYDTETIKFLNAFKIAIKNGVTIKILIDGVGIINFFRKSIEKKLAKIDGLEYAVFLPPQIPISTIFINLRNHRKAVIIDGKIAFFGGMNFSRANILINNLKKGILDIMFKINGPIVSQISEMFKNDWEFATGKKFEPILGYEKVNGDNNIIDFFKIPARLISDGPDNKNDVIELMIRGAINTALNKITIVTPYFLPENNILTALEIASMKGVKIEIIIPDKTDYLFINYAVRANFQRLVEKGIKIYRTTLPFDHSKFFLIDNEWVFIGSSNWDVRSLKLNFESNIEIFSKELATRLNEIIKKKKEKAKLTTIYECTNLSILKRIRNNVCKLITPYG
jgi:cardiolipin synthase